MGRWEYPHRGIPCGEWGVALFDDEDIAVGRRILGQINSLDHGTEYVAPFFGDDITILVLAAFDGPEFDGAPLD